MALSNIKYMDTDTGGGTVPGTNTSKVVKVNPVSSNTTTTNTNTNTSTGTTKKTGAKAVKTASTTPASTATQAANYARRASYSTPTYYNTYNPTKTEEVDNASKNSNNYLKLINNTAKNEQNAINNTANQYAAQSQANLDYTQRTYENAYNTNRAAYDQLARENAQREAATNQYTTDYYNRVAQQNAQREAAMNQTTNDYYNRMAQQNAQREAATLQSIQDYYSKMAAENKSRENATLDAIDAAYNGIMANAGEYYNNILGTYNRSMDFVNRGFDEGKQTTAQARDEAIQLAQALYDMGEETQNRQTERGLKGQYVSYMNSLRNLNQRLAAQGINGGASETSMLGALNGYEANRTDLQEARLAALSALRQTQMQSDSQANQAYLNKLADLISQRTNQYLGVENTRSQGEYNYANMKNSAESDRGNQLVSAQNNFQNWASNLEGNYANMNQTAQNNFQNWASNLEGNYANMSRENQIAYQNWASQLENNYANMGRENQNNYQNWSNNLTGQRASNETQYASNIGDLANSRNGVNYNQAVMQNQAAQTAADLYTSQAYLDQLNRLNDTNKKAKVAGTNSKKKSDSKSSDKKQSSDSNVKANTAKTYDISNDKKKSSKKKTTKK